MTTEDLAAWIQLSRIPGIGVVLFCRLIDTLGGAREALEAPTAELASIPGISRRIAERIRSADTPEEREEAEAELARAQRENIRIVTIRDPEYPEPLHSIYGPPPFLYVRGDLSALEPVAVAMVGTRQATSYGVRAAESMAAELAAAGITIVSGLAQGIDSGCHEGALAGGGKTVAVLGCGLGVPLPEKRKRLGDRIAERGAVVSEFGMEAPALPEHFPRRNRIISGLCAATVVVEAGEQSGALITASFALEQGRELFAVPGRVSDPQSAGCNRLLQEGAHLARSAADIREMIMARLPLSAATTAAKEGSDAHRTGTRDGSAAPRPEAKVPSVPLSEEEESVYRMLAVQPRHVDELTRASGLAPHRVAQILLGLELKGAVHRESGMRYTRS